MDKIFYTELPSGGVSLSLTETYTLDAIIVAPAVLGGWTATHDGRGVEDPPTTYSTREQAVAAAKAALCALLKKE